MSDLSTTYLGLPLRSPLVPSAGPLTEDIESLRRLAEAGAGAVVLPSLFVEQIGREDQTLSHYIRQGSESYSEALSYLPAPEQFHLGPEPYLDLVRDAKKALAIPVIASMNADSPGDWVSYAGRIQEAGADALELNIYRVAADMEASGAGLEERDLEIVRSIRSRLSIPLAVKLSPFYSAMGSMARRLTEAGASGLVLFNRFYQPDIDLEALEARPHISLSTEDELRLPLRWIAILHGRVQASLALTSGVASYQAALKALMAGADAAMLASELLRKGPGRLGEILSEMRRWMEEHEYESVAQMKGSISQASCKDPAAFERANYMKALTGYHVEAA